MADVRRMLLYEGLALAPILIFGPMMVLASQQFSGPVS